MPEKEVAEAIARMKVWAIETSGIRFVFFPDSAWEGLARAALDMPEAEWCCDLCAQPLAKGGRCNSGVHQGPDDPPGRGRAVPVERDEQRREIARWRRYYADTGGDVLIPDDRLLTPDEIARNASIIRRRAGLDG